MALVSLDLSPDRKTLRQFGVIALVFFAGIGAYVMWRHHLLGFDLPEDLATSLGTGLVALGAVSGLLAALFPPALRWLYVGLIVITFPIGFVVSHVILALLYYLVLTPIGLAMRLFGYDPMHRKLEPEAATYWVERAPRTNVQDYFKQY